MRSDLGSRSADGGPPFCMQVAILEGNRCSPLAQIRLLSAPRVRRGNHPTAPCSNQSRDGYRGPTAGRTSLRGGLEFHPGPMGSSCGSQPHCEEGADSCHPSERRKPRRPPFGSVGTFDPRSSCRSWPNWPHEHIFLDPNTNRARPSRIDARIINKRKAPAAVAPRTRPAESLSVETNSGMSVDELAKRGLDTIPGTCRYFERSPDALL